MKRFLNALVVSVVLLGMASVSQAETRLLMFEESGCSWCILWKREVGKVYALTDEGKRAPLVVLDIHQALPKGIRINSRARYTPTFVLIDGGAEVGRIEGYPGEDFFWGLLENMLNALDKAKIKS